MNEPSPALGQPVGVALCTPSLASVLPFYRGLFDWIPRQGGTGDPTHAGACLPVQVDGHRVATLHDGTDGGWLTVFAVDDVEPARRRAVGAGGSSATAIFGSGGPARLADHAGAPFLVTADRPVDAGPAPVRPGRPCWYEYMTTTPQPADLFYRTVLGLRPVRPEESADDGYQVFLADGRPVAGRLALPADLAATVPTGWMVYFAIPEVDEAARRVTELGGQIAVPPRDVPTGRVSVALDPAGAAFTLIGAVAPG